MRLRSFALRRLDRAVPRFHFTSGSTLGNSIKFMLTTDIVFHNNVKHHIIMFQ